MFIGATWPFNALLDLCTAKLVLLDTDFTGPNQVYLTESSENSKDCEKCKRMQFNAEWAVTKGRPVMTLLQSSIELSQTQVDQ